MLLSVRLLDNVADVNRFDWADQVSLTQGDGGAIYFQLIDANQDKAVHGYVPAGRRYMPAAGATLSVVLDNINDNVKITRAASQPFSQDPSIWKLQLLSSDTIKGTCALRVTLTEGTTVRRGSKSAAVLILPQSTVL
jgi:hypothetical protein